MSEKKTALFVALICSLITNVNGQGSAKTLNCISSECHSSLMAGEMVHGPVGDNCETCHEQNSDQHPLKEGKEFSLAEEMPGLCFECHEKPDEELIIHSAVSGGECIVCHSPHSSQNKYLLKAANAGSLCKECHDLETKENIVKHGPVISNQCTTCHETHQASIEGLLKSLPPELCFNCHEQKKEMLTLSTVHPVFEDDCRVCHSVHNSTETFLVVKATPELCFNCHRDVKEKLDKNPVVHKPLVENENCISCHDPHSSINLKLVLETEPELCFNCHAEEIESGKRKIINIEKKYSTSKSKHQPVAEGLCSECHYPHTSVNNFLLTAKFAKGSYASNTKAESFALCFECHNAEKIELKKTIEATNFRDGDINMHYLHIKKKKGRNCTTCHGLHGTEKPPLIADNVNYGNWKMPINYKKSESGGSCLPGCHAEFSYNRVIPDK